MTREEFEIVFEATVEHCRQVMFAKGRVYTTDDFLSNFKRAAALKGETPEQALHGMMTKHIIAASDAIHEEKAWSPEQWLENIGDQINYAILLRGLLVERANGAL